jgi:hypothetical protein
MRDGYKVQLFDEDGGVVEAVLLEGISEENLRDYAEKWQPLLQQLRLDTVARRTKGETSFDGEDAHWNWARLVGQAAGNLSIRQFAIEAEGTTQGMMQLSLLQRSRIETNQHLVYVDRLAAAPWNRNSNGGRKHLRPIGMLLIRHAIGTSFDEGFKGRIGLHSLPGAARFYQKLSMRSFGPDADHHSLEYFEMPADQANIDFLVN